MSIIACFTIAMFGANSWLQGEINQMDQHIKFLEEYAETSAELHRETRKVVSELGRVIDRQRRPRNAP